MADPLSTCAGNGEAELIMRPKTLYTAVFRAPEQMEPPSSSPSSMSSTNPTPSPSWVHLLSKRHLLLASLPPDYSPPPSPPLSPQNVALRMEHMHACGCAWESMRLSCIRRGYKPPPLPLAPDPILTQEWKLAETEEEWFEWEAQVEAETNLKRRVEGWQAGIGSISEAEVDGPASFQSHVRVSEANERAVETVEIKDETNSGLPILKPSNTLKKAHPMLEFPVVKPSSAPANTLAKRMKKGYHPPQSVAAEVEVAPHLSSDILQPSELSLHKPLVPVHIADVFDRDYLPPSFPARLPASTPLVSRSKPPPITASHPILDLGYSPSSLPQSHFSATPPSMPIHIYSPPIALELNPHDQSEMPSSAAPPPRSTPPRLPTPTPPGLRLISEHAKLVGLILQDSQEIFMPSTPDHGFQAESKALPTLTELLASSNVKPRPTPRKNLDWVRSPGVERDMSPFGGGRDEVENDGHQSEHGDRVKTHGGMPAPPLEYPFDGHAPLLPLVAPATKLMHRHQQSEEALFRPEYMSTQIPGNCAGPMTSGAAATETARGGSNDILWYGSQLEFEAQVDRVSELLERDIDFDGWLRDVRVDEEV